jgi:hypothetical protein
MGRGERVAAPKKKAPEQTPGQEVAQPIVKYVRLKNVTLPSDSQPAFQPEIVEIQGDTLLRKYLIDKRDVAHLAFHKAMLLVDPDSEF